MALELKGFRCKPASEPSGSRILVQLLAVRISGIVYQTVEIELGFGRTEVNFSFPVARWTFPGPPEVARYTNFGPAGPSVDFAIPSKSPSILREMYLVASSAGDAKVLAELTALACAVVIHEMPSLTVDVEYSAREILQKWGSASLDQISPKKVSPVPDAKPKVIEPKLVLKGMASGADWQTLELEVVDLQTDHERRTTFPVNMFTWDGKTGFEFKSTGHGVGPFWKAPLGMIQDADGEIFRIIIDPVSPDNERDLDERFAPTELALIASLAALIRHELPPVSEVAELTSRDYAQWLERADFMSRMFTRSERAVEVASL